MILAFLLLELCRSTCISPNTPLVGHKCDCQGQEVYCFHNVSGSIWGWATCNIIFGDIASKMTCAVDQTCEVETDYLGDPYGVCEDHHSSGGGSIATTVAVVAGVVGFVICCILCICVCVCICCCPCISACFAATCPCLAACCCGAAAGAAVAGGRGSNVVNVQQGASAAGGGAPPPPAYYNYPPPPQQFPPMAYPQPQPHPGQYQYINQQPPVVSQAPGTSPVTYTPPQRPVYAEEAKGREDLVQKGEDVSDGEERSLIGGEGQLESTTVKGD